MKKEPIVPNNENLLPVQSTGVTTNSNGADTIRAEFTASLKLPDGSGPPIVKKPTQQSRMTVNRVSSSSDFSSSSEYEESSSDGAETSSDHKSEDSEKVAFKRQEVPDEGSRLIGRTKLMMQLDKIGDPDQENSEDNLDNSFDDGSEEEEEGDGTDEESE